MHTINILPSNVTVYQVSHGGETALGVYLVILGWLSWIGNGVAILLLTKERKSLEPQDFLTYNLAVSDASIAVFGYSRGILEIFDAFKDEGYLIKTFWTCKVDGFLILLFGLISINTLTAVSVVRYIKGCQPHRAHHINRRNIGAVVAAVWLSSPFWASSPILGWGSYGARKYGTREVDRTQALYSLSVKLYVIGTVNSGHKSSRGGDVSERQRKMERSIMRVSLILRAAFLSAWSPYAVVSLWSARGYQVPPLDCILASLFAKSASFYNPFICIGMSSKFRKDLRAPFHCLRPTSAQRPAPPVPLARPGDVQLNMATLEEAVNVDSEVEMGHNANESILKGDDRGPPYQPESHSSSLMDSSHKSTCISVIQTSETKIG